MILVFQTIFTNINSTTDFCTLCKRVSRLSVEKFLFHSAVKFRRGTFLCFRKFRVSKNFMSKRGRARSSIKNLLSRSTEKLRRGTLLCLTKFPVSKKFRDKKGRRRKGVLRFSVRFFLSPSAQKFRRGTLYGVTNFGWRKIVCFRGLCHDFPSKILCLSVPKHFAGEPFGVSENFWYRKILCFRGLFHDFQSKIFCLTVPKHFVEEPFYAVFQKNSGNEKVSGKEGGGSIKISFQNFFSHSAEKCPRGTL